MKFDRKQDEVRSEVLRFMREVVGATRGFECKTTAGHDLIWFVVGSQAEMIRG